jgi:hypothetical protein
MPVPVPACRRVPRLLLAAALLAALAGCASWRGGAVDAAPAAGADAGAEASGDAERPALRDGWRWREQLPADAVTGAGEPAVTAAIGPDGTLLSVPASEATIVLSRLTAGGEGTTISLANQTASTLKFALFISPDGERWTGSDSCPVEPGEVAFESWPYPVAAFAIASPRVLAEGEPRSCR